MSTLFHSAANEADLKAMFKQKVHPVYLLYWHVTGTKVQILAMKEARRSGLRIQRMNYAVYLLYSVSWYNSTNSDDERGMQRWHEDWANEILDLYRTPSLLALLVLKYKF